MTDTGSRQRLTAILAADAVGYSRLMAANEAATVASLDSARSVFRSRIESHQGRVIDTAGDSVLAVFETAAGAVTAAMTIQEDLDAASRDLAEDRRMRFRIGVHLGDVIEKSDGTVYGDGVNIAARLQALAKPGGITVSDAVKVALRGRVQATFEDRGEQTVKNIPEPVRAYAIPVQGEIREAEPVRRRRPTRRLLVAAGIGATLAVLIGATLWLAPWRSRSDSLPPGQTALSLPSKPSIAVLPFDNMSGDAEQAYFADGVTEDLITDLSKVAGLFVIARNSTFAYKGKAKDIREVARALGVRYVLEGSVRRSGGDIRVNAQLIDATTGGHVWAERYDGDMKNIFGLQDKVTKSVVSALAVELTKEDRERVARRETENAEAYDVFLKGWQHYLRQTPEDFRTAIVHFKKATELDPKYGRAYAALAATYWAANTRYWSEALGLPRQHEGQFQAEQFLAKAMLHPTPLAHEVASAMALYAQQHDDAVSEAKKAVAADPNDADGYVALAGALTFSGKPREALESVERAIRLNPHSPSYYLYQLGLAQFGLNRLDEAAASLEKALALNPEDYWSQRLLLSIYGLLGRREKATKLVDEIKKASERKGRYAYQDPITIRGITYWYPFAARADAERFADGLRKAGVPD
ncbi:MAG TPA: adenylate/guanylate cyclase domain-containing protein [Terriglobales bacterium]|nr:adenylate/guanylate cyclase domain-containing protein [Terriglobales bacterium]